MKTALVTGGAKGIGLAIAKELKKSGYRTVINYFSDDINAKKVAEEFGFDTYRADVSDAESVTEMISYITKNIGDITVLVNSAGIALKQKTIMDVTDEEFDRVFGVNVKGMFNVTRAVLPVMVKNQNGVIVNVSSYQAESGASCEACYAATKGAVNSFTKSLAKEYSFAGIRVNAVAPGFIDTDMNSHLSLADREDFIKGLSVKRIGRPDDVAHAVMFLIENTYITGGVIPVDGGII